MYYEDSDLAKNEEWEMGSYINFALYCIDGFKVIGFSYCNPTSVSFTINCRVGNDWLCFGCHFNFQK
ncbi:MAG: hypothetical protein PHP87_05500 [Syntrophomonas sp.]|nr:hypothetical protein [Syntrophomonas sp.]